MEDCFTGLLLAGPIMCFRPVHMFRLLHSFKRLRTETRTWTTLHQNRSVIFYWGNGITWVTAIFLAIEKEQALLKITNHFYIGDLQECLYLSCVRFSICGRCRFISFSLCLKFHLLSSELHHLCSLSPLVIEWFPVTVKAEVLQKHSFFLCWKAFSNLTSCFMLFLRVSGRNGHT